MSSVFCRKAESGKPKTCYPVKFLEMALSPFLQSIVVSNFEIAGEHKLKDYILGSSQ